MMKNKNLLIGLCSVPLLLSISTNMTAQDLRERTYYLSSTYKCNFLGADNKQ